MSRFHDDSTCASDPGGLSLSDAKLAVFKRSLNPIQRLCALLQLQTPDALIAEHLKLGDSRAAMVVSVEPLLVAAYTDELDYIAMLRFPQPFVQAYALHPGSALPTVNTYGGGLRVSRDLTPGPNDLGRWSSFWPYIAEFLSDDRVRIESRKRSIGDDEWQRCIVLGLQYREQFGDRARDGSPYRSMVPA